MTNIINEVKTGESILFLGMGIFYNTKDEAGDQMPFDGDSMILRLNNGRAMPPRLMYEYTRAAMSLEQRKGRNYILGMSKKIYEAPFSMPKTYEMIKKIKPKYVIDTNIGTSLQEAYADVDHYLATGVSRIMASKARFVVYRYDQAQKTYTEIEPDALDDSLPILFQPMGAITPELNLIISDADFVDWLTEAMGGLAVPPFLKEYRKGKKYLFLGVDFSKDTFRMVGNEVTLGLQSGYVVTDKEEFSKKETKFIESHRLEVLKEDIDTFLDGFDG